MRPLRAPLAVFAVLMGSYAFFWHSRDWNTSSRLMLTYSLVDRGTVCIDGLEDHTRDRAKFEGHFYSDKMPGYSLLAVPSYAAWRAAGGPPHPLGRSGPEMVHWEGDYWATLGTSGVLSALTGAMLAGLALGLGCGPRRAFLVGVAYGLATPAFVYATLGHGHQATAFFLLASYLASTKAATGRPRLRSALAGFAASMASVVELQAGPASAVLGFYALALVLTKKIPPASLVTFAVGAAVPAAVLLGYNAAAFGSPFDLGYFHEDLGEFAKVHSRENPLGLAAFAWDRADDLLVSEARGLFFAAPILLLAPPGWMALAVARRWGALVVSLLICGAVFLVNLSYPEWSGGWCTGPRLLVPMIPLAFVPVAALLAVGGRAATTIAVVLALAGWAQMLMYQAVGARIPPPGSRDLALFDHPLREVVGPLMMGDRPPGWPPGWPYDLTIADRWTRGDKPRMTFGRGWVVVAPLVASQAAAVAAAIAWLRPEKRRHRPPVPVEVGGQDRGEPGPQPEANAPSSSRAWI